MNGESFGALLESWGWWPYIAPAVGYLVYRYFPAIAPHVMPLIGKVKPSDSDPRVNASDALRVLVDHTATIKCGKLRKQADDACTDLAEVVFRPPGYQPTESAE